MRHHKQKYLHEPEKGIYGSCWQTVIACLLDCELDEALPVQLLFDESDYWYFHLEMWLKGVGYKITRIEKHPDDKKLFYMVAGTSPRNPEISHVVIYQNGKMVHDPHPDGTGILDEKYIEILEKII